MFVQPLEVINNSKKTLAYYVIVHSAYITIKSDVVQKCIPEDYFAKHTKLQQFRIITIYTNSTLLTKDN